MRGQYTGMIGGGRWDEEWAHRRPALIVQTATNTKALAAYDP